MKEVLADYWWLLALLAFVLIGSVAIIVVGLSTGSPDKITWVEQNGHPCVIVERVLRCRP